MGALRESANPETRRLQGAISRVTQAPHLALALQDISSGQQLLFLALSVTRLELVLF